jgi:hypothetical protein
MRTSRLATTNQFLWLALIIGKGTTPLRLIQLLDSTPNNPTFDLFHPDTFNSEQFNFRSIQLLNNSTRRFFDTFNSEQSNSEQSDPEQSNSVFAKYDACNIYARSLSGWFWNLELEFWFSVIGVRGLILVSVCFYIKMSL